CLELFLSRFAVVPLLEVHEESCVVSGSNEAEKAEPNEARRLRNTGRLHDGFFDFVHHGARAFERCAVWQLYTDIRIALIFVGEKTCRDVVGKNPACGGKNCEHHNNYNGFLNKHSAPTHVAVRRTLEHAVEPIEEFPQQAAALLFGL